MKDYTNLRVKDEMSEPPKDMDFSTTTIPTLSTKTLRLLTVTLPVSMWACWDSSWNETTTSYHGRTSKAYITILTGDDKFGEGELFSSLYLAIC